MLSRRILAAAAICLALEGAWHSSCAAMRLALSRQVPPSAARRKRTLPALRRRGTLHWREVRAQLVAGGRGRPGAGWMHLTPGLVEVGSLLLAGAGAFALRRPELHRAVALVVSRGDDAGASRPRALLLNRPAAHGEQAPQVLAVQTRETGGFPLPGLRLLEDRHDPLATADLLVDVGGEVTWRSTQHLQAELDEKLWHSASVDSQALLELLRATPSDPSDPSDPAALWRRCARRLDVAEESELDAVGDELLSQWLKQNEEGTSEAGSSSLFPSSGISAPRRGDLLLTGAHAFAAGTQQFLHKAILIVLAVDGDEVLALCLNRPAPQASRASRASSPRAASRAPRGFGAALSRSRRQDSSEDTVHFGGDEDFDRWTCLSPGESHHDATPLGDSGLWWVRDAAEAWRTRRLSPCNMLFARGAVRLGSLELELWQRRGEMGLVRHWSPKLRDVLSACCSYEGPGARGKADNCQRDVCVGKLHSWCCQQLW